MTLPVQYFVSFKGVKQFELQQLHWNADLNFGTTANPRVRLIFNLTNIATEPVSENITIQVWLRYPGTAPATTIRSFLTVGATIVQAVETYVAGNLSPIQTPVIFSFNLNDYSPGYEISGQFEIVIDTGSTSVNAFALAYNNVAVEPQASLQQWTGGGGGGYTNITGDAAFKLYFSRAKTFDISSYVKEIKIDRGMSDIDGSFVEGEADVGLFNRDNRFSPLNQSSPYYEYWDVQAVMTITAVYQTVTYNLFKGFIERIRPDYEIDKRDIYVSLSDYFARFKEKKISVNVGTNQPPHVIIGLLLDALGVPSADRLIDTAETETLALKNRQNEDGIDALGEVVESGQHAHYIDGAGKYNFRTNNWPPDGPPDYVWDDCSVDDFQIEHDEKGIKNKFRVGNSTIGFFTLPVPSSIARYGQKDQSLDNDLIRTLGYAHEVCLNLQARFSGRVNGIDLTLKNCLPDILTMDVGKMVEFTEPLSGINAEKFIPLGLTYDIRPAGDIELSMKLKRFYQPPLWFYTGTGLVLVGPSAAAFKFQRFKMPFDGYISRLRTKFVITNTLTTGSYLSIYSDNAGIPGTLIDLSSNAILNGPGTFDIERTMGLLGNKQYEAGNYYWACLQLSSPAAVYQMYGSNPGNYPDGYAYTGGTAYPLIDFWFGLKLYPIPI